ncbi:hypothetical protein [Mycolicibacterium mageritense]|uniref:hypothetical protein n=1 Tax=Mycolicibacterium mageritense TaxID=53462 RepID=UPI001E657C33|nr:hypothetical protein [Mycolicibacterium mageritense]
MAANVRAELGRNRVTQARAASRTSMSAAALSKRLNAQLPFDIDQLAELAEVVDVDPAVFFIRHDDRASA